MSPAHYLQHMRISNVIRRKGDLVLTVRSSDTVEHLDAVLDEHRIGAVVVSDDDGATVAGIVSERDVVRALAARGVSVLEEAVTAIHTAEVHTIAPDAAIADVERDIVILELV